jgi:ectoine hydroxylase-related dioxygenase (phytanoyl-CoA dioxygenase family)
VVLWCGPGLDYEEGKFRRLVNLHLKINSLAKLFSQNISLSITDKIFNQPTTLYTSIYFEIGSTQDPHRDTPYFWTNPKHMYYGIWLALEDVNDNNGALEVIKGSHKIYDSEEFRSKIAKSSDVWGEYQKSVLDKCLKKNLKVTTVSVKKGDTIIWHPQLMHGGSKNINPYLSRNSFVCHVTPKNMNVYGLEKFFNPSQDSLIPSLDDKMIYKELDKRYIRDVGMWSMCQKLYFNI